MARNEKIVSLVAIGAVVFLVVVFFAEGWLRGPTTIKCDDGPRRTIDIREFVTKYSAYSVQFEATVADRVKLSGKVDPVVLQQLSESLQSGNEFRKYVVAGYNSCAISKAQYGQYGARFQAMDSLSRQIDHLVDKPDLSQGEKAQLADLIKQYTEFALKLDT